jgi:hypothetical protein
MREPVKKKQRGDKRATHEREADGHTIDDTDSRQGIKPWGRESNPMGGVCSKT